MTTSGAGRTVGPAGQLGRQRHLDPADGLDVPDAVEVLRRRRLRGGEALGAAPDPVGGAELFLANCATCHLGGGGLLGSPRTPDLFEERLPRGETEAAWREYLAMEERLRWIEQKEVSLAQPREIIERVYGAIQDFTQRETQLDDVTIVICRHNPDAV